eukprot:m.257558 g.257558  ORF g.257558 m.257558 type:complete len:135 (+) comp54567_c0_seq38:708-1112(+)
MLVRESALTACSFPASLTLNPLNRPNLPTNHLATRRLRLDWWGNLLLLLLLIAPLQERSSVRGFVAFSFFPSSKDRSSSVVSFQLSLLESLFFLFSMCIFHLSMLQAAPEPVEMPLGLETALGSEKCSEASTAV